MNNHENVYCAPSLELLQTDSELPLCTSLQNVDPFTGEPLGNEF